MATRRKTKARRSGVVKVYNTAEMSSSFPKSRKLMKQYNFTVYGDGTIVKREIKPRASRKKPRKPRKKSAKKRQKGRRYEKDSQRYVGVVFIPAFAYYALGTLIIGGTAGVIVNETTKTLIAKDYSSAEYEKARALNSKTDIVKYTVIGGVSLAVIALFMKRQYRFVVLYIRKT